MNLIYLGIFEKVFNWIMDKILMPVFNFLSSILNTVFTFIFNKILSPILLPLLEKIFRWALELVLNVLGSIFYFILQTLLKIIDYMQIAFDIFIGLRPVTLTQGGKPYSGSLLAVLAHLDSVRIAFLAITLAGLGLAFLLTIFSVTRSAIDLDFENKRSVGKVMTDFFKCCLRFMMVPVLMVFMLQFSVIVLAGFNTALTQGKAGTSTLGSTIFVISSLNAARDEKYNVGYTGTGQVQNIGTEDALRKDFYYNDVNRNYKNSVIVGGDGSDENQGLFKFGKFDYLTGYASSIFLILILAMCLVVFIQRIFEILILYIVSPYFVAMMPLDGGEKFDQWRELFIAKFFTGFGSAIGMRLYLMLVPIVMGNTLRFTEGNSPESDYIIKLLFILGGAWAIYKSGSTVTSLLSAQAGSSEQATGAMAGGMIMSQVHQLPGNVMGGINSVKGGAQSMRSGAQSAKNGVFRMKTKIQGAPDSIKRKSAHALQLSGKAVRKTTAAGRKVMSGTARTMKAIENSPATIKSGYKSLKQGVHNNNERLKRMPHNIKLNAKAFPHKMKVKIKAAPTIMSAKVQKWGKPVMQKIDRMGTFASENFESGMSGINEEVEGYRDARESVRASGSHIYSALRRDQSSERKADNNTIHTRPRSDQYAKPPRVKDLKINGTNKKGGK
ncbi:MAG: hypothetical protein RSB58_03245 [Clostridium sp.]